MKINLLSQSNNSPQNHINFKKGLTAAEINHVKNMSKYDYITITNRVSNRYGIVADVAKSNCVAFCLEKTAEIMQKAGLKLPSVFLFRPINSEALGFYGYEDNVVIINANYTEFNDLEKQNKLEENSGNNSPDTLHFLETYLHEFSHAAHLQNIRNNIKNETICEYVRNYLKKLSPTDLMINPMKYLISSLGNFAKTEEHVKTINEILSSSQSEKGEYAKKDLIEYMAEHNAREIALKLGENLDINNIKSDFSSMYKKHPEDWNTKIHKWLITNAAKINKKPSNFLKYCFRINEEEQKQVTNLWVITNLLIDLEYVTGDIWHGDISKIENKSLLKNL